MLTDRKALDKLRRIHAQYSARRFETLATVDARFAQTTEHFRRPPVDEPGLTWAPAPAGTRWGGSGVTGWFAGSVTLPAEAAGRKMWVRFHCGQEGMLFRDGQCWGVFDDNHPYVCLAPEGEPGRAYEVAVEAYSGHDFPGCMPDDGPIAVGTDSRVFDGITVAAERVDVSAFVFDLQVLGQLVEILDDNSLRKNQLARELARVFALVPQAPGETTEDVWRPLLAEAREIMRPLLECTNGDTAPTIGILGGSHMDTAWLWPIDETWRKVARTNSSMVNLMEQYPELIFIQSSPCHTAALLERYPDVFERMQPLVDAGRWEPNGGMWVEADCNVTGGEALVRQFLVGQRWTRAFQNYTADTLWLPDVFGYSAALPQILRGVGIEFFCTTKMAWNDTTRFPYDTFHWKGIDGTTVLAHLNAHHAWPDPRELTGQWNWVQHKDVQDRRLCAYGYGDGGGGPMHEMAEVARRVADLEGCPKTRNTTVSAFMQGIRDELGAALPTWAGELYLELHRGTTTSIAAIKKGNRRCEMALRDAELLWTVAALAGGSYPGEALLEQWKALLINQFHDILPGTSIAAVNDRAIAEFRACEAATRALAGEALETLGLGGDEDGASVALVNTLSWDRSAGLDLTGLPAGMVPCGEGVVAQAYKDVEGEWAVAVAGVTVPALGSVTVGLGAERGGAEAPFEVCGDEVRSPFWLARFDEAGGIGSLVCRATGREWVQPGGTLNALVLGEDIPAVWDNWDIDGDQQVKMQRETRLVIREVVAQGALRLRVRCRWQVGEGSQITQDVVFHADSPRIDFDTLVDWHEKHQLLKASFDLNVTATAARHEIQYGHVERPTHRNLPHDRARFEVCAHKWSDLSDQGGGVALLNDCKYGLGVHEGNLSLTLLKSGTHPDPRGDEGLHRFVYAILPHAAPFGMETVIRPAYELNVPLVTRVGAVASALAAPVSVEAANVVVEAVKWAEEGNAYVVRLYDAGRQQTRTRVTLPAMVKAVWQANMLEEPQTELALDAGGAVVVDLRPFEIVTLRCELG